MRPVATRRGPALLLAGLLALTGCTDPTTGPEPRSSTRADEGPRPTAPAETSAPPASPDTDRPRQPRANPNIERIPDWQWQRMRATGVWRPGCPAGRRELRRVEINYVNFAGQVRRGVLVVNRDVADSVARIFTTLFEERFPIRKMRPVIAYRGDSNASLRADNTSAYNCRRLSQINAPVKKSPHANGRAIDINPRENPWVDLRCDCWFPSRENRKRTPGKGKILKGGLVWRTFRREGWIWQNIDVPDYMHFDTGYPSTPYDGPPAPRVAEGER